MNLFRRKLFHMIEEGGTTGNRIYDSAMLIVILMSMIPLAVKEPPAALQILDFICVLIFIIDYVMRILIADYKMQKGAKSFVIYPFTPMAIIDLLAILPSVVEFSSVFRVLKVVRLSRAIRVLRFFKAFRYSKSITRVVHVIQAQKESLTAVCLLAFVYILISALIVFNVEPDTYETFFDAMYWATVSLTTVGYGDIYPTTVAGKVVTMASSIFGIAVVALPAGIITAGYMDELEKEREE